MAISRQHRHSSWGPAALRRSVTVVLILIAAGIVHSQPRKEVRDGWQLASPSEQGLDIELLNELVNKLKSQEKAIRSVVIVRNGKLALEYYRDGLGRSTLHDMRSATLSVVSTLVGVALQKGMIKSVDQPVADFLPEALGEGVDSRVSAMTLRHILTLTAGFDPDVKQVGRWAFPVDFALRRPLVSDPGRKFDFNPGTAHLAARVVVSATGESVSQFAEKQLFRPLRIERYLWRIDRPGGSELGYSGLQLTTRDMAKLGQLYLQHGSWNGTTVVPAQYVEAATRKQSSGGPPMHWAYGFSWWIAPVSRLPAPFMAGADDGQRIYVNPGLSLVVVVASDPRQGRSTSQSQVDLVINDIVLRVLRR
ncbi:serine hydrolase [Variovorax paradoxus]|nr:serine hydrolase [Variovorax paradoxus]MBT2302094.1 serine hydrolase [Variovorax paradoxus]